VANGPALGPEKPTWERLRATAVTASLPRAEGTIVGLYAAHGGERLVHQGEPTHLHVVLPGVRRAGHLDAARIEAGSLLRLPAMQ